MAATAAAIISCGTNVCYTTYGSLVASPDETRTFEKGKIELAKLGDVTIGKSNSRTGWSWEKCVKTNSQYKLLPSTTYSVYDIWGIKVVMDDGHRAYRICICGFEIGQGNRYCKTTWQIY